MANPLVVGQVWRMTTCCFNRQQAGMNVTYWNVTAVGATPATDVDMAAVQEGIVAPLYIQAIGNNSSWYGLKMSQVSPGLVFPLPVVSATLTGPGTGGVGTLPSAVCGIGELTTASQGKKFRGRTYIPFPYTVANDAILNQPTNPYNALAGAILTEYSTPTAIAVAGRTATIVPVLWHKATKTYTPITGFKGRIAWATQHRRGSYGRPNAFPPF